MEMKICQHDAGHMTKMAVKPYTCMVKTLQNLLLRKRSTDFNETWQVTSGTPAHHSLFK